MIVTHEGKYLSTDGAIYDVVDVGNPTEPYFRAYKDGGYYNVNVEPNNSPFDEVEIEMVKYVGPLQKPAWLPL